MEITVHANEMELTCLMTERGAVINRARTAARDVVVPESIEGRAVVALGPRAFAPHSDEGAPDHRLIRRVTLPDTLERVGDYAFYNCFALEQLRLSDRTRNWGASCLMNCRKLRRFDLAVTDENSPALHYFADELMTELDVTLRYEDGRSARLIFPEYTESFNDNKPAHFFDFHLSGPGLPYHHAFQGKRFDYGLFDGCWEEMLRREYEPECAVRLAFFRLFYPVGLSAKAAQRYREHLACHGEETVQWLLRERDSRGMDWFLKNFTLNGDAMSRALETARQTHQAESTALLLARRDGSVPKGRMKSFDL